MGYTIDQWFNSKYSAPDFKLKEGVVDEMRKVLLNIFGLSISVLTLIGVMIYGWGLEPKSWWWIIGMYLIGNISSVVIYLVANKK